MNDVKNSSLNGAKLILENYIVRIYGGSIVVNDVPYIYTLLFETHSPHHTINISRVWQRDKDSLMELISVTPVEEVMIKAEILKGY